ncbi:MAG: VCBS repeat-containing protein, partial [Actinotalea sp.]|nr:VCBS repeat-containing protein [Actinotalea sp.]
VTAPGDVDGDGLPDLVVVDRDARLLLYPGRSGGGLGPMRQLATLDRGTDLVVGAGDLNQDGHRDLLTRAAGRMTTWHGRTGPTVVRGTTWGSGWDAMAPVVPAENWAAQGRAALLGASARTGRMYLYAGQPAGALRATHRPAIPTEGVDALLVVGDVRGDGTADVLTRRTDGRLMLHESTASGAWRAPVQVGRGWGVFDLVTAAGDVDGDGVPDVLARERTTGNLRVYPMRRDGSFKSPFTIATGLAGQQVVAVGGWTATSSADVVTVDPATGAASLRRGRGAYQLAAPVSLGTIAKGQQLVGAGDFRRTGHNDLLALDSSGRLWLYPGSSTASIGARIAVGGIRPAGTGSLS